MPDVKDAAAAKPRDASTGDVVGPPDPCAGRNTAKTYAWTGPSVSKQGKCTVAQIDTMISKCIAAATSTPAKCDALQASAEYSKDCDRCLDGSGKGDDATSIKDFNVPVILPISIDGTEYGLLNTAACAAAVLGLGATCGNAVTQITACEFGYCAICSDESLDLCLANAAASTCKPLIDAIQSSCLDPIEAGKAIWEPLCTGGNSAFKDALPVMAAYMCGSAP